jgi:S-adenosylmethionine synthetase
VRHHLEHDVVRNVIPEHLIDKDTVLHLNPCGPFTMGGPMVCIYSIL